MKKTIQRMGRYVAKMSTVVFLLMLVFIQSSSAFLHDVEASLNNTFQAGTLMVGMRSDQTNFETNPLSLSPGDVVKRDIYVQKLGGLDTNYKSQFEMQPGSDTQLCSALDLKVYYYWYDAQPTGPNDFSARHAELKYSGPLANFSDFDTNSPTHDPEMVLMNAHPYFTNSYYGDTEHWFEYEVTLPADADPALRNLHCDFDIKTTGWQASMSDPTQGFSSTDTISSSLATSNWHVRNVSGMKFNDLNGNGTLDAGEPGLANWGIEAGRLVDEFDVQANSASPVTTAVLESGKNYMLRVSGTYGAGDSITADAKYSHRAPNAYWSDDVQHYESYGPELLDLQIDGSSPNWGDYNPDHVYWLQTAGNNAALSMLINDVYHPNNTGALHVEIYEVVASATTAADGTYSLDLANETGNLALFEVPQTGWAQTLPTNSNYYALSDVEETLNQNFGNQLYESQTTNDIVLNEILYDPVGTDNGVMPDGEFVELYNNTATDVDANGWMIRNEAGNVVTISASNSDNNLNTADGGETVVPAGGYLVVYLSQNDFMTNDMDTIALLDNTGSLQDVHRYMGGKAEGTTEARVPDGVGAWVDPLATPGRANVASSDDLEPTIRVWQEEPYNAKFSVFDAVNYDSATYELSYAHQVQEGDRAITVVGMMTGEIQIHEMREDKTHLYFATCSTGGVCVPHHNVDPSSIHLKVVLHGAGIPDRTLEVGLTGEWVETSAQGGAGQ